MMDYLKIGNANDLKNPRDRLIYRGLEILPGFLIWGTFLSLIMASWLAPIWAAYFTIAFSVYWVLKTIYFSLHLRVGFSETQKNLKKDWRKELEDLVEKEPPKNWRDIFHLVILPLYKENWQVVDSTFSALTNTVYPIKEKMIVVLAVEERAGESAQEVARAAEKKFGDKFFNFLITKHPEIDGELQGKGANETWAAKEAKRRFIDPLNIPYDKAIVSVFDIDTQVFPQYFTCLTYHYLTSPNPVRASFQPVAVYNNNIWDAPAFSRVIAASGTFWQMMQQERPEKLVTFSSHSMSFQALVEMDFWSLKNVSEDSRIFWQALLFYNGDYRAIPIHYQVSMDANLAPTFKQTAINVYKQQRRWAWGAENIPFVIFGFLKNRNIPFFRKILWSFHLIEGFWSWATNALMVFLLGWLPLVLGGPDFNVTVLSYNLPRLTRDLMTVATFGAILSAVYSMKILPPRPAHYGRFKNFSMVLQWCLLPATIIIFGSLPAIEAQTRLMFGRYMGFWVTEKHRK